MSEPKHIVSFQVPGCGCIVTLLAIYGFLALIAGRVLRCTPVPASPRGGSAWDRYGRLVARCRVNGVDVGDWMIAQRWAVGWPHG